MDLLEMRWICEYMWFIFDFPPYCMPDNLGLECLIKGADLQVIVVENDRGEEEALMELGPPVAVTGLMVKFVVLMMVMVMTSGTAFVYC